MKKQAQHTELPGWKKKLMKEQERAQQTELPEWKKKLMEKQAQQTELPGWKKKLMKEQAKTQQTELPEWKKKLMEKQAKQTEQSIKLPEKKELKSAIIIDTILSLINETPDTGNCGGFVSINPHGFSSLSVSRRYDDLKVCKLTPIKMKKQLHAYEIGVFMAYLCTGKKITNHSKIKLCSIKFNTEGKSDKEIILSLIALYPVLEEILIVILELHKIRKSIPNECGAFYTTNISSDIATPFDDNIHKHSSGLERNTIIWSCLPGYVYRGLILSKETIA
jgi:hypothetical protein